MAWNGDSNMAAFQNTAFHQSLMYDHTLQGQLRRLRCPMNVLLQRRSTGKSLCRRTEMSRFPWTRGDESE
jgi:hypothetical protein